MEATNEVSGYYGSGHTPCTIYTYGSPAGTWYAVHGSTNVNHTHDVVDDGVNVEELTDNNTFTAGWPITSEERLAAAVDEEPDPEEATDEQREEAKRLLWAGMQAIEDAAEYARKAFPDDAGRENEAALSAFDAFDKYELATALLRERITEGQRNDIFNALDGDGDAAANIDPSKVRVIVWPHTEPPEDVSGTLGRINKP